MSANTAPADRQSLRTARYQVIRRVTLIGAVADLALGVIKLSVGWVAHSQALMADGVHSLSDLSTDLLVIYVARHSKEGADSAHPYGHARFETMGTVGLGIALIAVSFGIGAEAFSRIIQSDRLVVPGVWALIAAAVSVVCKEVIYRYTIRYARKFKSNLLRANAWHSRSDALSSVVVIIGVGATMAGVPYVDALAAIVVALMIAQIGWSLAWKSIKELVDTGLGEQDIEDIRQIIMSVNGVAELHLLRTRKMGGQALVDVHIILDDPRVSVSEGHQISEPGN